MTRKIRLWSWLIATSSIGDLTVSFHVVVTKNNGISTTISRQPSSFLKTKTKCYASSKNALAAINEIVVGKEIGSGSYGTVHMLTMDDDDGKPTQFIGKRPWSKAELTEKGEIENPKERAERCLYYWQVEDHCFSKLPPHPQLPPYFGTHDDWMVFGLVGDDDNNTPAPTLSDLMKLDSENPQELENVGKVLGTKSYGETLDKTLQSMLTLLEHIHEHQIVHRDIKPSNVLVQDGNLLLMDFGSAADLEPVGIRKLRKGLENGNRVAVSPIYCAPEVFIDIYDAPTAFDMFSTGLLFCQLMFSYLDERTDAGFHQQLQDVDWDLNSWLSNELASKLRPGGLDHSLEYLAEHQGLWTLIERMLSKDPSNRPSATQARKRLEKILNGDGPEDCAFFGMVIESMETCPMPAISRPLHYVATFSRSESLGLVLSEMDDEDDNPQWVEATKFAQPGEVFIKEVVPGGQADTDLGGIFEVGDQLQGIGELPFKGGGFEKAVEMVSSISACIEYVNCKLSVISHFSLTYLVARPTKEC